MNYRKQVENFVELVLDVLYPKRQGSKCKVEISTFDIEHSLKSVLANNLAECNCDKEQVANDFMAHLPRIKDLLDKDIAAIYAGDPAATNELEIVIAYPGFHGIASYRLANLIYKFGIPLVPRIITENSHSTTGIDIHPKATIGESICIDHGTGVVIGQTSVLGNNVKIYQGVTLGALSIPKEKSSQKRHPTIEDNVVIYAQATILGGDTVIGKNSIIGGNVWITSSVPPNSKVIYDGKIVNKPLLQN